MKRIKNISLCLLGLPVIFCSQSCNKFGDLNSNPNAATTPVTSALLTNVESIVGNIAANQSTTPFYVQHYSQLQYPDAQLYSNTSIGWDDIYTGPLEDLQNIINVNTASPNPIANGGNSVNQIQIARILKAYYFMTLTDRYGDIPYFNALKGLPAVAYDKQQDIYKDLFKELKEAVAAFDASGGPIKGDIIFNGNLAKWQKLANSLRLIMALNLSNVDPATGKTEFMAALNEPSGYIGSNTDNFAVKYPGGNFNFPFYNLTGASQLAISEKLANKLTTYNDPRLFAYGQANASGVVKGVPYGLNRANIQNWLSANPDWSSVFATSLKTSTSSLVILSASYIDLVRAEAAITYNTGEDAYALLSKGVQDSWAQWSVNGDVVNYLAGLGVTNTASTTVNIIAEQIWITLFGSSMFAWDEWRRTGYPALSPAPDASSQFIPRRYGYPTSEGTLNANAYNAAVSAMPYGGTDNVRSRVWWDKP